MRKISSEDKDDAGETAIPAKVQAIIKNPNLTFAAKYISFKFSEISLVIMVNC